MTEYKSRYGVGQKLDFTAAQMREIAFAYRRRAQELGVVFLDDPFAQVVACIQQGAASPGTRRRPAPVPPVHGPRRGVGHGRGGAAHGVRQPQPGSGSGVTFTNNPLEPHSRQVRLFGDFAVRSQGEDLVGGLVFPLPISEAQRLGSPTYRSSEHSLERDFPADLRAAPERRPRPRGQREFDPQEIEFTFESAAADDLYVLQKRAVVQEQTKNAAYFDTSAPNFGAPVAVGMGVAGGAYSGRVAVNAAQIDKLLAEAPTRTSCCCGQTRCRKTSP